MRNRSRLMGRDLLRAVTGENGGAQKETVGCNCRMGVYGSNEWLGQRRSLKSVAGTRS